MVGKDDKCGIISQLGVQRIWGVITREPVISGFIRNMMKEGPSKGLIKICDQYIRSEQFLLSTSDDLSKMGMDRAWKYFLDDARYWASRHIPLPQLQTILEGSLKENVEEAKQKSEDYVYGKGR